MRYSATQPSGDQDGKALRAADVRAAAATATPAATPAGDVVRQVPTFAAGLHVPADAARLRPGQPRELHAGKPHEPLCCAIACDEARDDTIFCLATLLFIHVHVIIL